MASFNATPGSPGTGGMCVGVSSASNARIVDLEDTIPAVDQFGCFTASDVQLSRSALSKRVRTGTLRRVHRGVFFAGLGAMTFEQRCAAAVLAVGPGAAITGLSAARLLGVWNRTTPDAVQVICGRRGRHVTGVQVRYASTWDPVLDIRMCAGLPVVRCERLVIELATDLTRFQLTNIVKELAFRGLFRMDRFAETAVQQAGVRGLTRARRAVASYVAGCAGSRSALEDRMVRLLDVGQLPMPDDVGVPVGPHEVDLVWNRRRLIVEVDGPGHRQPNARKRDPERDADLAARGYAVARYSNWQIDHDPMTVLRSLNRLLG